MVLNALAALAVGRLLGVSEEQIKRGIACFASTSGRMHVTDTGNIKILNDAYNANPTSMAASICVAAKSGGRCVCILGDMFELGEKENEYHREIGKRATEEGVDLIVCAGELSRHTYEGAKDMGANTLHFPDRDSMLKALPGLIKKGDTVLIKASRGMHLETVVQWLKENY
jgi:UDP-N-acetylmuramoyl-tripeptide--D-alanyl-D-alanine ligase